VILVKPAQLLNAAVPILITLKVLTPSETVEGMVIADGVVIVFPVTLTSVTLVAVYITLSTVKV
jgi:hypothetical protein